MKRNLQHKIITIFCLFLGIGSLSHATESIIFKLNGVSGDIKDNIDSSLNIERRSLGNSASIDTIRSLYKKSHGLVKDAIAPYGYFSPRVKSKLRREGGVWVATYDIKIGKPTKVYKVNVGITGPGKDNQKVNQFIQKFPLKRGNIFTADDYNNAKDEFFDVTNNQGYIKASLSKSRVVVDPKKRDANVDLLMNSGKRYYFGKMSFNKTPYAESFLQRFNIFHNDEPFSNERLSDYQQLMNDSQYFQQVIVIPDIEGSKNHLVPLHTSIVPPKARQYDLGIGYGTFVGPRLTAGARFNRINDMGESMYAKLKLSSVQSGLAFNYTIPGNKPLYEWWTFTINGQEFRPKNGSSKSVNFSYAYLRKVNEWKFSASLNYLWERYDIATEDETTPKRNSQYLYPDLTISYLKTDDLINPTYGRSVRLNLKGAVADIASNTSFLQGEIKGKYLTSPFDFAQFIFRGSLGATAVHDLELLPLTLRFIAGGPSSIRGFQDSSIGPGKYLMIGSGEYRNRIYGNLSAAIFYDFGKATDHWDSTTNRGAGLGLVYNSPIGPIKLYAARALSKQGDPYQIEFVMGPEF